MIVKVDDSAGVLKTISNDITNLDWDTPRNVQDITGLDKAAMERLQLLADFSSTLNGVFDDAVNMAHDVFKTVPSTSVGNVVGDGLQNSRAIGPFWTARPFASIAGCPSGTPGGG